MNRSPDPPGLEKVKAPAAESQKPDQETEQELFDHKFKDEELQGLQQDRQERKTYANRIYWLIVVWLGMLFVMLGIQGFKPLNFSIDDKVLITLITGTTVNVIGIFLVVANYLFPRPPGSK